uniref:Cyclin N-terminal domain-containing protein n=1 Tax=Chaetoceros debilis TaxID=122233 RepID=A0A7S3QJF9_9STRA|mmetsp:Transcript_25601/g.39166  ORF Transcript_25601/g.39166 Transcript_25601/m.39166 type:complete len:334 (-) Transcript_25601:162-1163(-)|eukprot:CAMPEP_0194090474 /NCGR_PEP_ID=MMETSP0149-20130528/39166_1 /TAXON_ID=122233 /ORGANISM="Chaetoceros debilis, Strain MM31A-1" /LENGTH=333 /DNA_ID=CAMNT_0038774731 /DNA_START=160 /DNA_END=1161 /DNA_ORIENTATION=+
MTSKAASSFTSMQIEDSSDRMFKPIHQSSNASSMPIQSLQQVVSRSMEEVMESKSGSLPYGIETPIDEELSVCTEDLFIDMQERQVDFVSPAEYSTTATYLPYRRYLVDWMSDVGEQCRLHNSTVHVSILMLDKIFRSNEIPRSHWQLLATACISIAAKYEEAEEHCPPIPDLLQLTRLSQAGHTSLSFRDGEVECLKFLGWRLRAIPPIHFIGYFLAKGAIFQDDTWQDRNLIEKIPKYVKKYADFFCNLTLQEYSFQQYLPSELAAAILLASRVALQLQPRWRPELTTLTGQEESQIIHIFNHLWGYYEEQFPGHGSRSISPRSADMGPSI